MDLKLSNEYAYMIRKELQDTFGVNGPILAYQLYSNDMAKTKQKIEKNLEDEKRTIQKINEIMDDDYIEEEEIEENDLPLVKIESGVFEVTKKKVSPLRSMAQKMKEEIKKDDTNIKKE